MNSAPLNGKACWLQKNTPSLLALMTILLSFILFFVVIVYNLPKEREQLLIYILGVLSAIDTQIFSFYYGSSQGSREKDNRRRVIDENGTSDVKPI